MRYLHKEGIVHRDLKPENILVDSNFYPRVCDFGLSKCFPESLTKSMEKNMSGQFGTPLYSPPEILRGEETYDQTVDVYAFGMIAYEIVTGKQPFLEFGKISPFAFAKKVNDGYRPKLSKCVTNKMQRLISRCWSGTKSERPTFEEIFIELSNDLSYINEKLDEEEIEDYLSQLNKSNKERISKNKNREKDQKISELIMKKKELKLKEYFKKAAELDNSNALFNLGTLNQKGLGVKQNFLKAKEYYEKAAELGNNEALCSLGFIYYNGEGVEQNYYKAKEYFEKSSELNNACALFRLGVFYENGLGVERNYSKAKECYEKAAELGNEIAKFRLNNL